MMGFNHRRGEVDMGNVIQSFKEEQVNYINDYIKEQINKDVERIISQNPTQEKAIELIYERYAHFAQIGYAIHVYLSVKRGRLKELKMVKSHIFTFGGGHPLWDKYAVIVATTPELAREEMFKVYGNEWSMQYTVKEFERAKSEGFFLNLESLQTIVVGVNLTQPLKE